MNSPRLKLSFKGHSFGDSIQWQGAVRKKFLDCIRFKEGVGGSPVLASQTECEQGCGVVRRRYLVSMDASDPQPIYVFEPAAEKAPSPVTVIAIHGHGTTPFSGMYTFIPEFAKLGYRVVAPILTGKMERGPGGWDYRPRQACARLEAYAEARGSTLLGLRLGDVLLAYQFALQHLKSDPGKIVSAGLSMGGELALYLAAVTPAIPVCISAGFLSTFQSLLMERGGCPCYQIQGWQTQFEMSDIVGCIAPRPLQIQKGLDDPCFDSEDVDLAFEHVRDVYREMSQPGRVVYEGFPGGHVFDLGRAHEFIRSKLGG